MSVNIEDLQGLLSMEQLTEFDLGKYTMKLLQGTNRLYKMKTEHEIPSMAAMAMFRREGRFCDVIFSIHGQRYPAHKIVLASASPFLAEMFQQKNYLYESMIETIDFSSYVTNPIIMDSLLDFCYTSEVQLDEKSVIPMLTCCVALALNSLVDLCVAYLHDQLHPSNCIGFYLIGKKLNCAALLETAKNYVFDHFEEVVRHEEFLNLNFHDLCKMIKDDKVKVKCESVVYDSVMLWVRHSPVDRRAVLLQILPCVRLGSMGPRFVECLMHCEDFASADMRNCREYLEDVHQNLTLHRYSSIPPRRAPMKPLVIYSVAGYYNQSISTMECYYLPRKKWKRCADLQIPRSGVGVVALHMRVYVIGGRHNTRNENKDCRDVERYDPFLNQWIRMPPMIHPRNRLGVAAIDNCLYAVGGSFGQQVHASVERYTTAPDAESWVEIAPMHIGRIGLAVCTHSRLMYAIGGFDGHRRLADVECYDPDKNEWRREEPMRVSRSGAAASALDEYIYVVGGYASDSIEGPMQLDTVERYNILTQQWTLITPMNCRRSALSCVTLDNRLYAIGGYDGNAFSSVVEIFDPEKGQWSYGTPLLQERSGHGSALTVEPTIPDDD